MWAANENFSCRFLCFFVKSQHSHLPNFCSSCLCHGGCTVTEFCDFCETMLGSCKVTLNETVKRQCFTGRWKCEMDNSGWTKDGWSFMQPCFIMFFFFFPLVLPVTVHQSDIAETRQLRFYPDCHYFFSWQVWWYVWSISCRHTAFIVTFIVSIHVVYILFKRDRVRGGM